MDADSGMPTSATRLLTRHFLHRLLDNDLISPQADRHETVSMTCAALISSGLFMSVLLSAKYLMAPFPTPAAMAMVSLDDKFLFVAASMLAMALVAVAEWDALPLDERDTSILGPLPIPRSAVVFAKMAALVLFAGGFAVVLNVGPSVLFPLFLLARVPVSLVDAVMAIATHFIVTIASGAFGMLSVVGLREMLRLCLGARLFRRVSTSVQALLIVGCAAAFLLLPALSVRVARWAIVPDTSIVYALPPVWFVGAYESAVGHILDNVPRGRAPRRIAAAERAATAAYRGRRSLFRDLASMAATALGATALVSVAAYAWNNRKLPLPVVTRSTGRTWRSRILTAVATRTLARRAVVQAGFFFTLQTLPRSAPHRLAMATALALALALVTVSLRGTDLTPAAEAGAAPLAVWVVQTMLIGVLLLGFRHATRVPAFLPASWSFHLAWSGDEREYLKGAKRAAFVIVALPLVTLLAPLHAFAFGPLAALAHGACGLLLARLLLDVLFLGVPQPPFACSYVPSGNLKMVAPILIVACAVLAYAFAGLERFALDRARPAAWFFVALAVLVVGVRALDAWQRRLRVVIEMDEAPAATQRLDLSS